MADEATKSRHPVGRDVEAVVVGNTLELFERWQLDWHADLPVASGALGCAVAMQRAFAERTDGSDEPIRVRIGLNAGEPVAEDEDLFGTAVLAHEGQPLEPDTLQVEVECGFVRQPRSEGGQAAPSEEVAQRADVLRRAGETMDQQTADVAAFEEEGAGSRHYTHASLPCDPVVYAREFPCALRTPRIDDAYANAPSAPRQPRAIEPCLVSAQLDCATGRCRPERRRRC